jgi:hypothetical protein
MHRIEGAFYDDTGGTNLFQDSSNGGTRVTAAWLNSVQEELCNLLEGAGGTVATQGTDSSRNQIYTAFANAGIIVPQVETISPMSSNYEFDAFDGFQKIFILNPDGNYNFSPDNADFNDGCSVIVLNMTAHTITFVSSLASTTIVNEAKRFVYSGYAYTQWALVNAT